MFENYKTVGDLDAEELWNLIGNPAPESLEIDNVEDSGDVFYIDLCFTDYETEPELEVRQWFEIEKNAPLEDLVSTVRREALLDFTKVDVCNENVASIDDVSGDTFEEMASHFSDVMKSLADKIASELGL